MSVALDSLTRPRPTMPGALFSFIIIGAGGAACFVVLSTLVVWLDTGLAEWLTNMACYGALIGPVYLLQRRFSFRSRSAHRRALPRYVAVQALALLLAAVFSLLAYGALALPAIPASMLVIGLTSGVNFVVLRAWAFADAPNGTAEA